MFCLSVRHFNPNYLRTGGKEWVEKFLEHLCHKIMSQKKPPRGAGWARVEGQKDVTNYPYVLVVGMSKVGSFCFAKCLADIGGGLARCICMGPFLYGICSIWTSKVT